MESLQHQAIVHENVPLELLHWVLLHCHNHFFSSGGLLVEGSFAMLELASSCANNLHLAIPILDFSIASLTTSMGCILLALFLFRLRWFPMFKQMSIQGLTIIHLYGKIVYIYNLEFLNFC